MNKITPFLATLAMSVLSMSATGQIKPKLERVSNAGEAVLTAEEQSDPSGQIAIDLVQYPVARPSDCPPSIPITKCCSAYHPCK